MHILSKWVIYTCCCILLSSCEFNCSIGKKSDDPKDTKTVTNSVTEKNGTIITNNISLSSKGFKIKKATLLLPDDTRVSDDNVVELNQKIKLAIFIDEGWKLKNGKIFPGASEKMSTDDGVTVLNAEDLFADNTTSGFNAEDGKEISLTAYVSKENTGVKYYMVNFRVWDKNSDAEITGHYKFYIKH